METLDTELMKKLDRLKVQRQCTKPELEERADMFKKMGLNKAANAIEIEILQMAR